MNSRLALVATSLALLTACSSADTVPADPDSASSASSSSSAESSTGQQELSDLIRIEQPVPLASVSSPLTVKGQARGYWFFEASFPVKLLDESGDAIATGIAQADGEWMTEEFVPFTATLEFTTTDETGTLVLAKDNPSGLPENDRSMEVPVTFE